LENAGNVDVVGDFARALAEPIARAKLLVVAKFNQQEHELFVATYRRGVKRQISFLVRETAKLRVALEEEAGDLRMPTLACCMKHRQPRIRLCVKGCFRL
jgi:hypothetical protein